MPTCWMSGRPATAPRCPACASCWMLCWPSSPASRGASPTTSGTGRSGAAAGGRVCHTVSAAGWESSWGVREAHVGRHAFALLPGKLKKLARYVHPAAACLAPLKYAFLNTLCVPAPLLPIATALETRAAPGKGEEAQAERRAAKRAAERAAKAAEEEAAAAAAAAEAAPKRQRTKLVAVRRVHTEYRFPAEREEYLQREAAAAAGLSLEGWQAAQAEETEEAEAQQAQQEAAEGEEAEAQQEQQQQQEQQEGEEEAGAGAAAAEPPAGV